MKVKWRSVKIISALCLLPICVHTQSTIEFQSGTTIEVTTGADICADVITINGSYSGGGTQCGGALPVELVSFAVSEKGTTVVLTWQTVTEANNYGFEIEKTVISHQSSVISWSKAGFIEGNGTTNSPKQYSFEDKNPSAGKYLYRLKQIDRDGKFSYSQEVEVTITSVPKEFALEQNYPNPFNPSTVISYQLPINSHVTLKIYDATGREMTTLVNEMKEAGYYSATFDGSKLSSGVYFVRLQSNGKQMMKKILLMK